MKKIEVLKPIRPLPSDAKPTAPAVPTDFDDETMLPEEVAEELKVSKSFLAKARMRGDGPPYEKFGRVVRYTRSKVRAWRKAQQHNSTSEY